MVIPSKTQKSPEIKDFELLVKFWLRQLNQVTLLGFAPVRAFSAQAGSAVQVQLGKEAKQKRSPFGLRFVLRL
jgi:hypothetical protein